MACAPPARYRWSCECASLDTSEPTAESCSVVRGRICALALVQPKQGRRMQGNYARDKLPQPSIQRRARHRRNSHNCAAGTCSMGQNNLRKNSTRLDPNKEQKNFSLSSGRVWESMLLSSHYFTLPRRLCYLGLTTIFSVSATGPRKI